MPLTVLWHLGECNAVVSDQRLGSGFMVAKDQEMMVKGMFVVKLVGSSQPRDYKLCTGDGEVILRSYSK